MIRIDALTTDDVAAAMELVAAAGWNQKPGDWQRVIGYRPWGCFKATLDGRLVGTVTSTSYGKELAWIGMMLVDPTVRRQGIGRGLMQRVVECLRSAGMGTIKLDATPLGRPLYEQLGFVAQFDFQRWRRAVIEQRPDNHCQLTTDDSSVAVQRLMTLATSDEVGTHLDRRAFGVDRLEWLKRIAADSQCLTTEAGFGMIRSGRVADYLGPVVAASAAEAQSIIVRLVRSTQKEVYWDLISTLPEIPTLASQLGFEPVRVLTRMVLGSDATAPLLDLQYALCDPATG